MTQVTQCWCGNEYLNPFSEDYLECSACGTLVSQAGLKGEQLQVQDDEHDFYGKEYWFSHQIQEYGFPDIAQRARQDLPERCVYWLRTLLQYKLPPANVLELGCAHGGSVALLRWAGFDAIGLEMSPWVVEFAHKTFDIPMVVGRVEEQSIAPGSLEAIVLYDVLEHLPDPLGTMNFCASLLKEDGIFIVQMPNYEEGKRYETMVEQNDLFLEQMKSVEHLHLFSRRAAQQFFEQLKFKYLEFEPALFAYDMFFVASRQPLVKQTDDNIEKSLLSSPSGRLIQALLDKRAESIQLKETLKFVEDDRAKAFQIVEKFGQDIQTLTVQLQNTQSNLERSQNQLYETNSKYLFAQSQFELAHQEYTQTQTQLAQTRSELQEQQTQLAQTRSELEEHQTQLAQTQKHLNETKVALENSQTKVKNFKGKLQNLRMKLKEHEAELAAIQTSKFWKLRTQWFKFKRWVRLEQ